MNKLDDSLDEVLNTRFGNKYGHLIKQMSKQTQFNQLEVASILFVYYKFVLANGPKAKCMTKKQFYHLFLALFRVYDHHIIERILGHLAISESKTEVDPIAWVKLFSVFMTNKLEQKMKFAFSVYKNADGIINRDMVSTSVDRFFVGDDEDEINELRSDMVELIFQVFDVDRDGNISYDEYSSVVMREPNLLEFLGRCLPSVNYQTVTAVCANISSKLGDLI